MKHHNYKVYEKCKTQLLNPITIFRHNNDLLFIITCLAGNIDGARLIMGFERVSYKAREFGVQIAYKKGHTQIFSEFVLDHHSILPEACRKKDEHMINRRIEVGDNDAKSAIFAAIESGSYKTVRHLIEARSRLSGEISMEEAVEHAKSLNLHYIAQFISESWFFVSIIYVRSNPIT